MSETPLAHHLSQVHGWAQEALQEGEAFLRSQPGYGKFDDIIDAINGEYRDVKPVGLSELSVNHFGKIALDLVSALTDIKPFWEYRTFNQKFDRQSTMAGKLSESWWLNRNIDLKFADCIKYAAAMGTGYPSIVWNPDTADQDVIPEDPRDVLPIRPGSLISIQDSFAVIYRRERTVNYMRHQYPNPLYGKITADRDASFRSTQAQTRTSRILNSMGMTSGFLQNLFSSVGGRPQARPLNVPSVDSFTVYVKDDSVNESDSPVYMGEWEKTEYGPRAVNNWSYKVEKGERLYPRKRCIVFTRTALLYDGPSIYWHGLYPSPKLTLDPWPWLWLGKAPLKDLLVMQRALDRCVRVWDDHNEKVGRPDIIADKNSISRAFMERMDSRRAGLKIRHNPVAGQGVRIEQPPPLDPAIGLFINFMIERMDKMSSVPEMSQMMQLNQLPATETVERLLESMSPAIRMRSRVMEAFLREFAMIVLSNFFQFYTLPQRLAVLGPDGMTFEDFDYDPGTLIPDFVNDDDFANGMVTPEAMKRGPLPRDERARTFLRNFTYHVAPGSLLSSSEVTRKLLYIQLSRQGVVDMWTLLEILGIPNVGEPPQGANTIMERLVLQNQLGLGQTVSAAGRKATGQQMPRMKISESG